MKRMNHSGRITAVQRKPYSSSIVIETLRKSASSEENYIFPQWNIRTRHHTNRPTTWEQAYITP